VTDAARIDPAAWLPQTGAMVLLDEVLLRDTDRIECRATTHRRMDHPLAHRGRLPVWAGIEYAAQAIALHRALDNAVPRRPRVGFLGALRDVALLAERLDDVDAPLLISATKLFADDKGAVYGFAVRPEGRDGVLLTGRATVVQS
jgi:predicted hotdog family 3-hydroxylacyl-ACP dehydratase